MNNGVRFKKCISLFGCVLAVFLLVGCGNIRPSKGASEYIGSNYQDVIAELQNDGFTVFENTEVVDLTSKDSMPDGYIEVISIDGQSGFTSETKFSKDACVAIKYHIIKKLASPIDADQILSSDVEDIVAAFESEGFSDVSKEELYDLDPDEVEDDHINEVMISGKHVVNTTDVFPFDADVKVVCHYPYKKYDVKISVEFERNILFSKYSVDVTFDGQNVTTLDHAQDWESQYRLKKGVYELRFSKNGDESVNGAVTLDISGNTEAAYSIKCHGGNIDVNNKYFNQDPDTEQFENTIDEVVDTVETVEEPKVSLSNEKPSPVKEQTGNNVITFKDIEKAAFDSSMVPAYSDQPYAEIHENKPYFLSAIYGDRAFDVQSEDNTYYSDLDILERSGQVYTVVSKTNLPTEPRGEIGHLRPTGWQTIKYPDLIEDLYLYNRCHLIGYQLGGIDADLRNLITGTRYLNKQGMLPFENMIAEYVKESNNHVLYRVTPVYNRNNPVADGVLMEAYSAEDYGSGVEFCVFVYNVQPGISIDYTTGESSVVSDSKTQEEAVSIQNESSTVSKTVPGNESNTNQDQSAKSTDTSKKETGTSSDTGHSNFNTYDNPEQQNTADTWVLNKRSKKIHKPNCQSVAKIAPKNYATSNESIEALKKKGYTTCGQCFN